MAFIKDRQMRAPIAIALIGVPMAFIFIRQVAFGVSERFPAFHFARSDAFLFVLIGVSLVAGVVAIWKQPPGRLGDAALIAVSILYLLGMGSALLVVGFVQACVNTGCVR
jgi:hypothetical protein